MTVGRPPILSLIWNRPAAEGPSYMTFVMICLRVMHTQGQICASGCPLCICVSMHTLAHM